MFIQFFNDYFYYIFLSFYFISFIVFFYDLIFIVKSYDNEKDFMNNINSLYLIFFIIYSPIFVILFLIFSFRGKYLC